MSDKLDIIYDLLKSDREDASDFRKEVRESNRNTNDRLGTLEGLGQIQNQQLGDHMRRTEILEGLHGNNVGRIEINEDKIQELEKPVSFSTVKKWFIGLGAIAAASVAIAKFLGMF